MDAPIDDRLKRIRTYRRGKGLSKSTLADAAGVSDTTLRDIDKESWNPRADTIRKLEAVIPANWSAPSDTEGAAA